MLAKPIPSAEATQRRRRAEERLKALQPETPQDRTEVETQRLVHELQVHQIELEMQNEELQQTRAQLEALLAQYTDLYDFAPMGYFSLSMGGAIIEVNLTGARLIGIERARLLDRDFTSLVAEADRPLFKAFLEKVFAAGCRASCEVALLGATVDSRFVHINAAACGAQQECRAAVLDVSARHRAEAERELLIQELQTALARVKLLSGMLPVCAGCKKIRDDEGFWNQVESYIQEHSKVTFTHGLCPDCIRKYYPGMDDTNPGATATGVSTESTALKQPQA